MHTYTSIHKCILTVSSLFAFIVANTFISLCLLQSAKELSSHMKKPRDIQIYWSTAQCSMLKGDIVLIDW